MDYSILGSMLRYSNFGKLPCSLSLHSSAEKAEVGKTKVAVIEYRG